MVVTTAEVPVLDGILDEDLWKRIDPIDDYWQYFPNDDKEAEASTEIYFTYDEKNLYIGVRCHTIGDELIVPSLRRDYRAGGSDNITLIFDTFDDRTNAFYFGINPLGVRREGLIAGGGQEIEGFSGSWDNAWKGEAHIFEDRWEAELIIPFKTLRFKEGSEKWGFLSYRFDMQQNERSVWPSIPRNQWIFNLAFCGDLIWQKPLKKPGSNVVVIPYVAGNAAQDREEGEGNLQPGWGLGGDAKLGLGPSLNLDLTFNPDFSQVEVDRQVTNLDRFEIFFPERRQFFLENADLFANFGSPSTRPFFSRRIGVAQDSSTGQNIQNPIWYGARLSGKLNNNTRVGLLNMATAAEGAKGIPSFNYTVAALQQKVFKRSNISFLFVNKDALTDSTGEFDPGGLRPNRTFGVDYNLASADGIWGGKIFYHHNFSDTISNQGFAHGVNLTHNVRRLRSTWAHEWVGQDFDAQVGFVRRTGFFQIRPRMELLFFPAGKYLNQHSLAVELRSIWTPEDGLTDRILQGRYEFRFTNTATANIVYNNTFTYLFSSFDPSGTDGLPLPEETAYNYQDIRLSYNTDRRKILSARFNVFGGEYFNGERLGFSANANLRLQPYSIIGLQLNYNKINLPDPYSDADLWLVGPRIDLTFSKYVFLTTFIQYNNQINNLNINSRFQWRFAPVSDLFIVYTENYLPTDFSVKNRSLILKLTYWLNV